MKALTVIGCVALLGFTALFTSVQKPLENPKALEGVWELQHQFLYENDMVIDTLYNENGYRQVKIYSQGRVMWTRHDPADANEWFGFGTYTVKDGILEERLEYASDPMMKIMDTTQIFRFELVMDGRRYQQIEIDENGHHSRSENYIKLKK